MVKTMRTSPKPSRPAKPGNARQPGRPAADARRDMHQDVREQLLDTALALFAQQGVAATTISQIAAQTGVTPAMVHYYFKNRGHLLDAVVDERIARVIRAVWAPLGEPSGDSGDDAHDGDVASLIAGVVHRLVHGIETTPWLPMLWIREILNEGGALRERVFRHIPLTQVRRLTERIAVEQQRGTIPCDVVPWLVPVSIIGLTLLPLAIGGRIAQSLSGGPAIDGERLARHVVSVLSGGLAQAHSGA